MKRKKEIEVVCYICGKPVSIMKARSGMDCKPCHGECLTKLLKRTVSTSMKDIFLSTNSGTPTYPDFFNMDTNTFQKVIK